MICKPCADEADGKVEPITIGRTLPHCPDCDRQIQPSVTRWGPDADENGLLVPHAPLSWHKVAPGGPVCDGVGRDAVWRPSSTPRIIVGHEACQGCDCKHKPKGSWNGKR